MMNKQFNELAELHGAVLPGIGAVEVQRSSGTIPLLCDEEDSCDQDETSLDELGDHFAFEPDSVRVVLAGKYAIAGGLVKDNDAEDPTCSMDGEGAIHFANGDYGDKKEFWSCIGHDVDNEDRDLSLEGFQDRLADLVMTAMKDDPALTEDLLARCELFFDFEEDEDRWRWIRDRVVDALQDSTDYDALEASFTGNAHSDDEVRSILKALLPNIDILIDRAWDEGMAAGAIGNPLAVGLDVFYSWSNTLEVDGSVLMGVVPGSRDAVWVPDTVAEENIRSIVCDKFPTYKPGSAEYIKACAIQSVEYAKSCIETWNQWSEGDVYGWCVYVIDRTTGEEVAPSESCWGFYGEEYAQQELEEMMLGELNAIVRKLSASANDHQIALPLAA